MWERLYNIFITLTTLGAKVENHEKEIDTLKRENRELSGILHEILAELRGVSQQRESDRREIALFIENQLLKFERRLPSGEVKKDDDEKN